MNKSNIINLIPNKDSPELFQDKTCKDYNEFLVFDINSPLKKFDFLYYNKQIYFIYDIINNKYFVINLLNNKIDTLIYPFNYLKIDGYDPNILKNIYHNLCKKMK